MTTGHRSGRRRLIRRSTTLALLVAAACSSPPPDDVSPALSAPGATGTPTSSAAAPTPAPLDDPTGTTTVATATTPPEPTTASTGTDRTTVACGTASPTSLGFDPFYAQYCDAAGLPVLASAAVDPRAVERTAEIIVAMIGHRPDLIEAMAAGGVRIGVMGRDEVTTDLPEYRDLDTLFPGTDWDTRSRGLGATAFIPLSSVAEENVLCLAGDVYRGESILVHEFAHTVHIMGLDVVDPGFSGRLAAIYEAAMAAGLWSDTYASSNPDEYFAEAVQSWFDANQGGPVGGDGIHNDVDTRDELAGYDPAIGQLIAEVFRPDPLILCDG